MLARGVSRATMKKATGNDTLNLSVVAQTLRLSPDTDTYELLLMTVVLESCYQWEQMAGRCLLTFLRNGENLYLTHV